MRKEIIHQHYRDPNRKPEVKKTRTKLSTHQVGTTGLELAKKADGTIDWDKYPEACLLALKTLSNIEEKLTEMDMNLDED